jgi:hypothetical protein
MYSIMVEKSGLGARQQRTSHAITVDTFVTDRLRVIDMENCRMYFERAPFRRHRHDRDS